MSDFFCPLPWIHQFIQPSGIKVCCSNTEQLAVTSEEFQRSEFLQDIKQTILSGCAPKSCEVCVKNEANNLTSTRTDALRDWPTYTAKTVPHAIKYLDLRYDNLCNFSCRTCEPNFSTSISKELEEHSELRRFYNTNFVKLNRDNISSEIKEHYLTLRRLNLTGGEPLLIKENLKILQELIDLDRTDVQLIITTNVSTVNPKMLMLISQFDDVHWTLSIDAIEDAAEYIRYGSKWSVIEKNVHDILGLEHSVAINTTISAYSVLTLSKLLLWFSELKETYNNQPLEIMFHTVNFPRHLQPQALSGSRKHQGILELHRSIDILKDIPSNPERELDNLRHLHAALINSSEHAGLVKKFNEFTIMLDSIRNQNFNQTFTVEI
jgi:hypothetical protein